MPELTTSVAQFAVTTLTPALPQPSKQFATAALIGFVKTCCDGFFGF
ncbi:MAG: hypothetical protein GJU74_11860 [Metallibacterium scheffleri]|nr:hypothetical protein [Metallibacterium scheffleri]